MSTWNFYSLLWVNFAVVFFSAAFLNRIQNLVGKDLPKNSAFPSFLVCGFGKGLWQFPGSRRSIAGLRSWNTDPLWRRVAWSALAFCRAQGINPSWFILYSRLPGLCWKLVTIQDMTGWLFDLFLFFVCHFVWFLLGKKTPRLRWGTSFFSRVVACQFGPWFRACHLSRRHVQVILRSDLVTDVSIKNYPGVWPMKSAKKSLGSWTVGVFQQKIESFSHDSPTEKSWCRETATHDRQVSGTTATEPAETA